MRGSFLSYILDDRGGVTVDWTVLSASAVAMSLATVGVLSGGIESLVSRMDAEMREQQLSDTFIGFTPAHFEPLLEQNLTTASFAEELFETATDMMNQDVINALAQGIEAIENGTLTQDDAAILVALASVARQRNIVDTTVLDYYFGFDGSSGVMYDLF